MLKLLVVMSAALALAFSVILPRTFAQANEYCSLNATLSRGSNVDSGEQSFAALRAALSTNCNLLDGAEFSGPSLDIKSLTLLHAHFIRSTQDVDQMILSLKGALRPGLMSNCSSKFPRQSVDCSVEVLDGKKKVDLFGC